MTLFYFFSILFVVYELALHLLFFVVRHFHVFNKSLQLAFSSKGKTKKLVIVGGGYAGTLISSDLESEFETVLIDNKEYFEFTPSKLRALVDPTHTSKMRSRYSTFLPKVRVIQETVSSVNEKCVRAGGRDFHYDYLVICTGSRYLDPDSFIPTVPSPRPMYSPQISIDVDEEFNGLKDSVIVSAREKDLEFRNSTLRSSNHVLIIGGGTVGVELAAEIVHFFPKKKITLVHSGETLIGRSPSRAINYATKFLLKNGVRVVLNDRVVSKNQEGMFVTQKGEEIDAQLALIATGNVPNTDFLRNGTYSTSLDSRGFIKVNPFLQMVGSSNVFVAGDILSIDEEKLCQTAGDHSSIIVKNIRAIEKGREMKRYNPSPCPMLISLGKFDGILTYREWTLTGFVPAAMKEFVEWREMAQFYLPSWFSSKKKNYALEI